jgi:hypothetical protein
MRSTGSHPIARQASAGASSPCAPLNGKPWLEEKALGSWGRPKDLGETAPRRRPWDLVGRGLRWLRGRPVLGARACSRGLLGARVNLGVGETYGPVGRKWQRPALHLCEVQEVMWCSLITMRCFWRLQPACGVGATCSTWIMEAVLGFLSSQVEDLIRACPPWSGQSIEFRMAPYLRRGKLWGHEIL